MRNRIKSERALLGLNQEKLAERLGVTRMTISNWENGEGDISSNMITKMSVEIFKCSADWLLGISSRRELPEKSA